MIEQMSETECISRINQVLKNWGKSTHDSVQQAIIENIECTIATYFAGKEIVLDIKEFSLYSAKFCLIVEVVSFPDDLRNTHWLFDFKDENDKIRSVFSTNFPCVGEDLNVYLAGADRELDNNKIVVAFKTAEDREKCVKNFQAALDQFNLVRYKKFSNDI